MRRPPRNPEWGTCNVTTEVLDWKPHENDAIHACWRKGTNHLTMLLTMEGCTPAHIRDYSCNASCFRSFPCHQRRDLVYLSVCQRLRDLLLRGGFEVLPFPTAEPCNCRCRSNTICWRRRTFALASTGGGGKAWLCNLQSTGFRHLLAVLEPLDFGCALQIIELLHSFFMPFR